MASVIASAVEDQSATFVTEGALQQAHLSELTRHQRLGIPVVAVRNGRVVELRPEETSGACLIPPRGGWPSQSLKRAMDVMIVVLSAWWALPLIAALWAAVAVNERRNPVCVRLAVGRNGRPIRTYRFATGSGDIADEDGHGRPPSRFGAFLRRKGLDHLPELWSVLRGDLSVIGPRPLTRMELTRRGDFGSQLLTVRPGLISPAQVLGRESVPFGKRVAIDDFYVRNWSVQFDIQILRAWARRTFR